MLSKYQNPGKVSDENITPNDHISIHDDVIKWKHFPRYWLFVRGIHRLLVNSPHKGQWRGALMFSLICAWINGSINNDEPGDLRRHCAHYDVTVMFSITPIQKMNYFNESLETIPPCIYKQARLARAVLVTKFEKHPLFPFRWFRTKKHSFINRNRCSIKTLLFEAKCAFSLYKIQIPFLWQW